MVTFDSPLYRCEKCGEFVLLDQTVRECADEHRCGTASCPMAEFFDSSNHGEQEGRGTTRGQTRNR